MKNDKKAHQIFFKWICPSCNKTEERSYRTLAENGEPYCPDEECGDTMKLGDEE